MQAFFNEKFTNGFILSETELTKICDIIDNRINKKNYSLKFRIHREDNILIQYDDKYSVLSEENSKINRISRLEIFSENKEFNLNLAFDKDDSIKLSISSDDRDIVNLLSSDLRSYLKAEVLTLRSIEIGGAFIKKIMMICMIFVSIIMMFMIYETVNLSNADNISDILSSSDLHTKINYLITKKTENTLGISKVTLPLLSGMLALLLIVIPMEKIIKYIFPVNIFYWGREKVRYDKYKEIKKQIIWGIIITFIVSILAGYAIK